MQYLENLKKMFHLLYVDLQLYLNYLIQLCRICSNNIDTNTLHIKMMHLFGTVIVIIRDEIKLKIDKYHSFMKMFVFSNEIGFILDDNVNRHNCIMYNRHIFKINANITMEIVNITEIKAAMRPLVISDSRIAVFSRLLKQQQMRVG